jgi:hypothetical protein
LFDCHGRLAVREVEWRVRVESGCQLGHAALGVQQRVILFENPLLGGCESHRLLL